MADTSLKNVSTSSSGVDPKVEDLQAQVSLLREEIGRLTSLAGDVGKAEARRAADAALAKGQEIKAEGKAQIDDLRRQAEGYGHDAARYVREQPMNSLGLALGAGFLLGFILSNRR